MKTTLFAALALLAGAFTAAADDEVITLDLTKTDTPLTFNENNGAWTETYNTEKQSVSAQIFSFNKWGFAEYGMWWGFTPSNSCDNTRKEDTVTYQFSNMAKGGISLNEDGTIMTDDFADPVTSENVPYLIGYYADYMSEHPCEMTFTDGKAHEAVGCYVNLLSYNYYAVVEGDAYCRNFRNGDDLTLTVAGVGADGVQREVTTSLASASNGDITAARGWKYVDLSGLGAVTTLWFSMATTDMGQWGANTPLYFALDKVMVKAAGLDAIGEIEDETVPKASEVKIYNLQGMEVDSTARGLLIVNGRKRLIR